MKSKILLTSVIYTVVSWALALLVGLNPGGNDNYSTIIFAAYLVVVIFGVFAMYLIIVISAIVSIVKSCREGGDKSAVKPCIINTVISLALISTVYLHGFVLNFHF